MAKKILMVDDSPSVRQMMGLTLQGAGYEVIEAQDGEDALRKLRGGVVNMVITDLNMPHMNGLELVSILRRNPENRFLPIVVLTTEGDDRVRQQGRQAGASGWICKPFKPHQLLAVVRTVLPN